MQSPQALLEEVPDPRRGRALRYPLSAVLASLVLAKVAGKQGGRHAETFSKALPQKELEFLGYPFNRRTQRYEAPSDTTFQRVMASVEPSALERAAQRRVALSAPAGAGGRWQANPRREPPESGRPPLGDGLAGRSP